MSQPSVERDPFEVVAELFLARFRAGQRPSVEELAAQYPELSDQIRELLPALVMVEQELTIDRDQNDEQPPPAATRGNEFRLGDYRILREIGRGGMGVVYEAEQVSLGRRVALKVLPRHVAVDGQALERFRREAKAAARLHHTNIVPVFEVGRDAEVAYYAMQFIQGQGLEQVIDELARLRGHERTPGRSGSPARTAAAAEIGTREQPPGRIAKSLLSGRGSPLQ
jgi:Protein kinase domain